MHGRIQNQIPDLKKGHENGFPRLMHKLARNFYNMNRALHKQSVTFDDCKGAVRRDVSNSFGMTLARTLSTSFRTNISA
jgi:hypothetical protein